MVATCMRAMLLLVLVAPAWAQSTKDYERESLRGMKGVDVTARVEERTGHFAAFVAAEEVEARLEMKLRQAGVRVLTTEEGAADANQPSLDVYIHALADDISDDGRILSYALYLELVVNQLVYVPRNAAGTQTRYLDTWKKRKILVYGTSTLQQGAVQAALDGLADMFVNDWLATHN